MKMDSNENRLKQILPWWIFSEEIIVQMDDLRGMMAI